MDRTVSYTMCISIPFNQETSVIWSGNSRVKKAAVEQTMQFIDATIQSESFISMEEIMRMIGTRPTKHIPGIFFNGISDYELSYDEINQTDVLTLWLTYDFNIRRVHHSERTTFTDYAKQYHAQKYNTDEDGDEILVQKQAIHKIVKKKEEKEEPWDTSNGSKETSDSGEKEET